LAVLLLDFLTFYTSIRDLCMENLVFGMPFLTAMIFIGVPIIIASLLCWWGFSYKASDDDESRKDGGSK
jgi:hypothetical protein